MLRIAAETTLGELLARRRAGGRAPASAWRWPARPAPARAACCGSSPGSSGRERGTVWCGERVWLDTGRGVDLPPEDAPLRLRVPGLRAVPAPERLAERRLRAEGRPRRERRDRGARAARPLRARRPGRRPAAHAVGRRAPAGRRRARAGRPPAALLLDEPLSALDARTRAAASRELAAVLHEAAVPALLVTHDFQEAALLGDRVGVMDAGRVVQVGTAGDLAATPRSPFVADFTGAVVLTGTAAPGADGLTRVALDGGGEVTSHRGRRRPGRGDRVPVGHRARAARQRRPGLGAQPPRRRGRIRDRRRRPRARRSGRTSAAHRGAHGAGGAGHERRARAARGGLVEGDGDAPPAALLVRIQTFPTGIVHNAPPGTRPNRWRLCICQSVCRGSPPP